MNYLPVEQLPDNKPVSIVLRHAERDPIVNFRKGYLLELTEKGKADARDLGKELTQFTPIKLYHSPVKRCKQTAAGILDGILEKNAQGELMGELMDLAGPYITGKWKKVSAIAEEKGMLGFIRSWFDGEFPEDLVMPLREAAKVGLQILVDQLELNNTSTINISHDWNMMVLREHFFNLKHEDVDPPDFLDGFAAYLNDDKLHLHYHEQKKILDLPLK